jgi:hypothetical protein
MRKKCSSRFHAYGVAADIFVAASAIPVAEKSRHRIAAASLERATENIPGSRFSHTSINGGRSHGRKRPNSLRMHFLLCISPGSQQPSAS